MAVELDDEDKNARRNLVVFSTGIIASAWFNIPFMAIMSRLIGTEVKLDEARVWIAGFALLIYFGARYRFSKGHRTWGNWNHNDLEVLLLRYHGGLARLIVSVYNRTGYLGSLFVPSLYEKYPRNGPRQALSCFYNSRSNNWRKLEVVDRKSDAQQQVLKGFEVQLRHPFVFLNSRLARAHAALYGEASINYLFPPVLALAAAVVLLNRVVTKLVPETVLFYF